MTAMHTFDFDDAVTMHRAWKMKFHLALGSVQGRDYDTQPIGDAAQCKLGIWLTANAGQLERYAAALELRAVHEEFHRQSKDIADNIRNGNILSMGDPAIAAYLSLSERIEDLLLQLKAHLQP